VAKPRDRWRVRRFAKASLSSIRRWKMLWAGKAVLVDARAGEAVLVPRSTSGPSGPAGSGARQGASEATHAGPVRGRKRRGRMAPRNRVPGATTSSEEEARRDAREPKLDVRRLALIHLGSDCRKVVRRRHARDQRASAPRARAAGHLDASRGAREAGDLCGYSCREVGCRSRLEASSTQRRGEPRGKPRSVRGSTKRKPHP